MKKYLTPFFCLILTVFCSTASASVILSTFENSVVADGWSYDATTSTISGTDAPGAVLYPESFEPVDLSILGSPNTLSLSLTGLVTTAPVGAFSITLEDNSSNLSVTFFSWSSFTTNPSTVSVPVNVPVTFNWNNVIGWTLDAGGSGGAVNATFTELTVVPEPSTYALLSMAGMALGGYLWHRRQ